MKHVQELGRRHFLRAMGLGWLAASLPAPRPARAMETPLRFIGVYTPHGVVRDLYRPRPGFDITYPECVLAPFDDPVTYGRSFKDQLRVVDGIDLTAGIEVGTVAHDGARVILTGSGADGLNSSIDQELAQGYGLGSSTPIASLTLGVGSSDLRIGSCISYARGGTPVPKWIDPRATFEHLFGDGALGTGRAVERRELRRSVLDFIDRDLQSLSRRLPAHERLKLEQHQTALRELEKRLEPRAVSCEPGPAPEAFASVGPGGEQHFDRITDLMIDLTSLAFGCDLTRFATLMLADLSHTGLFPDLPADIHSDVAHRYDERALSRADAGPELPASWLSLARQNRYSYGKVARLMSRLDAASVLGNTILYVSSDMGDPARHSSRNVPTLIAGGAGGHFGPGRFIDLRCEAASCPAPRPNNRVLVSVLRAFGIEATTFGHAQDPAIVTGPLDELGS